MIRRQEVKTFLVELVCDCGRLAWKESGGFGSKYVYVCNREGCERGFRLETWDSYPRLEHEPRLPEELRP